jgi:hypothetical protein
VLAPVQWTLLLRLGAREPKSGAGIFAALGRLLAEWIVTGSMDKFGDISWLSEI